jgi:DinB family
MTDREFFIKIIDDELPRFDRLFRAIPSQNTDYRPDPKSKTAIELAVYVAIEASSVVEILKTSKVDFGKLSRPDWKTAEEAAENFSKFLSEAKNIAAKLTEADWQSPAQMFAGTKMEWETSKGQMVWSLLLDFIHHRGQLSTYIRPMGGKVPSIYGPSADSV